MLKSGKAYCPLPDFLTLLREQIFIIDNYLIDFLNSGNAGC